MYSFDADVGRLSVSTPRYAAAIFVHNRDAFPYGGIDLARFFDGGGTPVGGVGGRPPASFGVIVRGGGGRRMLASQRSSPGASLVLDRSPRGRVSRARRLPRTPDAGPFGELEATGRVSRGGVAVTVRHRFTAGYVECTWTVDRRRRLQRAEVLFPSWGTGARITAVRGDGSEAPVTPGERPLAADEVAYFHLAGPAGGYVVVLPGGRGRAFAQRVARQPSAPRAGPSLVVALPVGAGLTARIAPAADAEEARLVAATLR